MTQITWTARNARATTATLMSNVTERSVTSVADLIALLSQPLQLLLTASHRVTSGSIVRLILKDYSN